MTRWLWIVFAAVAVVAVGLYLWSSGDLMRLSPAATSQAPQKQAAVPQEVPPAPPASPTAEKAPQTAPSGPTPEKEAAATSAPQPPAPAPPATPASAQQAAATSASQAAAPASGAPPEPTKAEKVPQTAMGAGTAGKQAATATAAAPAPGPATASAPAASSGQKEQEPGNGNTTAHSNDKANAEVASLKPGIVPQDLVTALNDSAITFPSSSAEVPQSARDFLTKAAGDLKQLPPGYVLEIAGYTDDSGDAAINRRLSQRRADAVRDALIAGGAKPDMLMAKGYGSADPIASNDTPEGRARNRRIEYRVVKQR